MEKQVQLIQITAEQLQNKIIKGVAEQLQELEKSFQPKEPTEYLSRNDVATMLQVNLSTLFNWNKQKILQPYQIGGRVYYKRSEIEKAVVKVEIAK
ncbi:helix-turn-helix domain-containing protein [Tenacibaculum pacificus]|uniref:helix-turn-helix domain-containing protein n=1 Tax=Tenacibaculum pacificus TaxID=3018314 RepID=UPI0022F3CE51|nr:helix-turn-helix domain-containing protein [Tenacibaculum pacificus]WBX73388.1 helix-turn-helix domain-containing protein [Tenacibaculum pacificus]